MKTTAKSSLMLFTILAVSYALPVPLLAKDRERVVISSHRFKLAVVMGRIVFTREFGDEIRDLWRIESDAVYQGNSALTVNARGQLTLTDVGKQNTPIKCAPANEHLEGRWHLYADLADGRRYVTFEIDPKGVSDKIRELRPALSKEITEAFSIAEIAP